MLTVKVLEHNDTFSSCDTNEFSSLELYLLFHSLLSTKLETNQIYFNAFAKSEK